MARNNYWVSPDEEGWKVQREGSQRASRLFDTQRAAEDYGRNILRGGDGGELITQNRMGQIRSKDTINSNDPRSSRDTEH